MVAALLGPACLACGWHGGQHRPWGLWLAPCPLWDPLQVEGWRS